MTIAKRMTIHDVALAAGVPVSTASLVLNRRGRISSAIGERVNAAIEQLGFVRNRQVSALRDEQSGVIGLIVRDLFTPFYAELTAGLTETLETQGRMVFLLHGNKDGKQLAQHFAMLLNQRVDGVVIAGAAGSNDDLRQLATGKGTLVVFTSRASYSDDIDTVRSDNIQAAQLLVEHLIRHGHQRITWLGGQNSSLARTGRVGDYCTMLLKCGLPFHSGWMLECLFSQKQAAEEVTVLLRRGPTISVVVCYNETTAVGAWFDLMRAGRQSGEVDVDRYFGQQVSLVGFTDVVENAPGDIPIIWAYTPTRKMGYTLVERMLRRIGHDDGHSRNSTLFAHLVVAK